MRDLNEIMLAAESFVESQKGLLVVGAEQNLKMTLFNKMASMANYTNKEVTKYLKDSKPVWWERSLLAGRIMRVMSDGTVLLRENGAKANDFALMIDRFTWQRMVAFWNECEAKREE